MKKLGITITILLLGLSICGQELIFNKVDSLYYLDSLFKKKADGIISYREQYHIREQNSLTIFPDSNIIYLDSGYIIKKVVYDASSNKPYKKVTYSYYQNQIDDGIYEIISKTNFKDTSYKKSDFVMYRKGERDGTSYSYNYFTNNVDGIINYKNGLRKGPAIFLFPNGKPKELITYENNIQTGVYLLYYEKPHTLKARIYLKNNKYHGRYELFWKNSNRKLNTTYVNDLQHGKREIYNENGELVVVQEIKMGELINTKIYSDSLNKELQRLLFDSQK